MEVPATSKILPTYLDAPVNITKNFFYLEIHEFSILNYELFMARVDTSYLRDGRQKGRRKQDRDM